VNPEHVGKDSETGEPARAKLSVLSGEQAFEQTSPIVENPGLWYCPLLGALITAAGRLLLALLERSVTDAGGTYLLWRYCQMLWMGEVRRRSPEPSNRP